MTDSLCRKRKLVDLFIPCDLLLHILWELQAVGAENSNTASPFTTTKISLYYK